MCPLVQGVPAVTLAEHKAICVADFPASVNEPFGVTAFGVRVQVNGVFSDTPRGMAGYLGALSSVFGEVSGDHGISNRVQVRLDGFVPGDG
jgi:hypothetical protein